jgi:hypothetical protein
MLSRLLFVTLPIAGTVAAVLCAGSSQAQPPRSSCPQERSVYDVISVSDDANTFRQQMEEFRNHLLVGGTTVRLGPDVDIDFTRLPGSFYPMRFGPCVTLTSVSAFTDGPPPATATTRSRNPRLVPPLGGLRPDGAAKITEARTPQSRGPVLRYGKSRNVVKDPVKDSVDVVTPTFLEIKCGQDKTENAGVRISGFRLYGPDLSYQTTDEVGIRILRCVDIEISNMEIAGWGSAGISIENDPITARDHRSEGICPDVMIMNADQVRIHDNFFHHNQQPNHNVIVGWRTENVGGKQVQVPIYKGTAGGYGVDVGHGAWAQISSNAFDFNRHAIAGAFDSGGYVAERNLVLQGGGYHGAWYKTYTHIFDVHGSGCWWSSDLCGDAGLEFLYLANAFQYRKDNAIHIRGKPGKFACITQNIFTHEKKDDAINLYTEDNVTVDPSNLFNVDSFGKYGVCDFDGDGVDDLFLPTGATWWFSSFGEFQWTFLNVQKEGLGEAKLGYFDDDLRCDVLTERNGQWGFFSGGIGEWQPLGPGTFGVPLSEVQFGRFDPNVRDHRPGATRRTTHAFRRAPDGQWFVTPLSHVDWKLVGSSSFPMNQLRFGDFTGDGVTDVLAVEEGHWAISESAASPWRRLNPTLGDLRGTSVHRQHGSGRQHRRYHAPRTQQPALSGRQLDG